MPHRPRFATRRSRAAVASLLTAAAALILPACQSAVTPDYGNAGSEKYYESLVAREIMRDAYGEKAFASGGGPTLIGGVTEVVPVDSPGPSGTGTAATYPAPTTNPSIATASLIGRAAAALHTDEPVVNLSLQDVIARTVQHSLAIKVESYNPAIKAAQVVEADAGTFDPVFFGNSTWSKNDDPSTTVPNFANGQSWNNQFGVKKVLPLGTQIQASTGTNFRDISLAGVPSAYLLTAPNPLSTWSTNWNLQLTQPLMQGFGVAVNEANIYLAQRDLRVSQAEFRLQVMNTVAKAEEAYWNLVQARTNVETLERLVVASEQTYKAIYDRIPVDATTASVNQALSALWSRRADLLVAQKQLRNASDALKTIINDPSLDIESNALINPADRPIIQTVNYDQLESIETALRQRPEMQQARLQLEKADIVITVAKNSLLPKVDLTLAVQSNGLSGGFDQAVQGTIDPINAVDYTIGIKFEIPIGNRQAQYALERHQNERRQAIAQLVSDAKQVVDNVKNQLREVQSLNDEIPYRDSVRVAAANEFQGIIDIENVRPRTPEFLQLKLDSQANLAQAEQSLTSVIINYNIAIMHLEQAKGTLLEFNRISLDKAPKPPSDDALNVLRYHGSTDLTKPPAK